ncbi:hypothetical protein JCM10207_009284 [Rhodosporidiobolus poonsookiae]
MPPIDPAAAHDDRPFHVHLTGFGPFGPYATNPSWEAVRRLDGLILAADPSTSTSSPPTPPRSSSRPIRLTASLLPVTYSACTALVPALHHAVPKPDLIVHVGVGLAGSVRLEQRARKWGYEKRDVDGELGPLEERGKRRGCAGEELRGVAEELRTQVAGEKVVDFLRRSGVEHVGLSEGAGLYLCEYTFYSSLAAALLADPSSPTPVQFVHVPPLGQPYTLDDLIGILQLTVWAIVNEGGLPL